MATASGAAMIRGGGGGAGRAATTHAEPRSARTTSDSFIVGLFIRRTDPATRTMVKVAPHPVVRVRSVGRCATEDASAMSSAVATPTAASASTALAASDVAAPGSDVTAPRSDETAAIASPERRDRDSTVHEAATVERRREVEAPRIAPPAMAEPGEAPRSEGPEVRPRSPSPYPRCNHPRPSVDRGVDELVRLAVSTGRHIRVRVSIRHPDPTVLGGVDPLPGGSGLGGWSLRLGWRRRKSVRWRRQWLRRVSPELAGRGSRLWVGRSHFRAVLCRPGRRWRKEQRPGHDERLDEGSHGFTPASGGAAGVPAWTTPGRRLSTVPADVSARRNSPTPSSRCDVPPHCGGAVRPHEARFVLRLRARRRLTRCSQPGTATDRAHEAGGGALRPLPAQPYFFPGFAAASSRASTFVPRRSSSAAARISVRSRCISLQPYQVT